MEGRVHVTDYWPNVLNVGYDFICFNLDRRDIIILFSLKDPL